MLIFEVRVCFFDVDEFLCEFVFIEVLEVLEVSVGFGFGMLLGCFLFVYLFVFMLLFLLMFFWMFSVVLGFVELFLVMVFGWFVGLYG